nr:hypothetical protein [Tanacetum cinerariifolium]
MAYISQGSSSSNTKVHTCSKECLKSYEALQKQYDKQYEAFKKSHLDIIAYQVGLESLEARIVVHEKNEAVYEEDIAFLKYDVQTGLGYDSQINKSDLNDVHVNESQVIGNSLIDSHESDGEDNQVNDRFKKSEGYHTVPPPYTGNYIPRRADLSFAGLDDSLFKFAISKTVTSVNETKTSTSNTSKESLEKPKTVRPSALIIEEWESDSEDENVVKKTEVKKTVKPSFEKIKFVNAWNTTVKNESKAKKPRKLRQISRVNTASPKEMINAVGTNWVCNGLGSQEGLIFLCDGKLIDKIGRFSEVNRREDNKAEAVATACYTQCNTPKMGRSGILSPGRVTS